jgi:hypothetical protein
MIREQRASGTAYDGAADVFRVVCQTGEILAKETAKVDLLLDGSGHLVGIDLGGEGFQRLVIMLGAHEAVTSQQPAEVEIARDAKGEVLYVAIPKGKALVKP